MLDEFNQMNDIIEINNTNKPMASIILVPEGNDSKWNNPYLMKILKITFIDSFGK